MFLTMSKYFRFVILCLSSYENSKAEGIKLNDEHCKVRPRCYYCINSSNHKNERLHYTPIQHSDLQPKSYQILESLVVQNYFLRFLFNIA